MQPASLSHRTRDRSGTQGLLEGAGHPFQRRARKRPCAARRALSQAPADNRGLWARIAVTDRPGRAAAAQSAVGTTPGAGNRDRAADAALAPTDRAGQAEGVAERTEPRQRGSPAGHGTDGDPPPWNDRADETHEPSTVAEWAELHAKVETLPTAERAIFSFTGARERICCLRGACPTTTYCGLLAPRPASGFVAGASGFSCKRFSTSARVCLN